MNPKKEKRLVTPVVTAIFNSGIYLRGLVKSLRNQTDKNSEWALADGQSADETVAIVRAACDLRFWILERADLFLYDALNDMVNASTGEYCTVAGADDVSEVDAIPSYGAAAGSDVGIVTGTPRHAGCPKGCAT